MRSRLYTALLAMLTMLILGAGPASAVDLPFPNPLGKLECLSPPSPASPDSGVSGWLDPGPGKTITEDPFAKGGTATVYEAYGYAGLSSHKFDRGDLKGCTPEFDPANTLTNWTIGTTTALQALVARLYFTVFDGGLGDALQPLSELAARALGWSILLPLLGVAVCATGLWFVYRSRRGDLVESIAKSAGTAIILVLGVAAFVYPFTVGKAVDSGMSQAIGAVNQTVADGRETNTTVQERKDAVASDAEQRESEGAKVLQGRADDGSQAPKGENAHTATSVIASNLYEATLWNSWTQATFGRGNEAAAKEFGPALFKASAYTRAEAEQIKKDPGKAKEMREKKQKEYTEVAKKVEKKYPAAYEHLAGKNIGSRLGFWAISGLLATVAAAGLVLYSLCRWMWASVVTRIGIGAAPLIALGAQFPTLQDKAMVLVKWVMTAIVTAVAFGAVTAVYVVAGLGVLLSPSTDMHMIVKIFLLAFVSMAAWALLRRLGMTFNLTKKITPISPGLTRLFKRNKNDEEESPQQSSREMFDEQESDNVDRAETHLSTHTVNTGTQPFALPAGQGAQDHRQTTRRVDVTRTDVKNDVKDGATSGAATAIAAGVATGGTATVGALAAAAAKGAAKGALSSSAKGAVNRSVNKSYDLHQPEESSRQERGGETSLRTRRADSSVPIDPTTLYDPSDRLPSHLRQAPVKVEGSAQVFDIYTPAGASR